MASSTGDSPSPSPSHNGRRLESMPVIDLSLFTQTELYALSVYSNAAIPRRCDDIVIPKIDRSVFNESDGSRKQTYSRFSLSPRKAASSNAADSPTPQLGDDPERAEDARIIRLLKDLMNGKDLVPGCVERNDSAPQLPKVDEVQNVINAPNVVNAGKKRGRGRPRKTENRLAVNVPNAGKKRGRGRPRKNENRLAVVNVPNAVHVGKKRGRGRPPKNENRLAVVNVPNAVNVGKKRARGRPRKYEIRFEVVNVPNVVNVLMKRGRGRPRKIENRLAVVAPLVEVVETPAVAKVDRNEAAREDFTVDANVGDSEVKEDN